MNPCDTWLTDDAASRQAASARAVALDDVLEDVVKNTKLKNIQLAYLDFSKMMEEALDILKQQGLPQSQLIDAIDGTYNA